MSTLKKNLRPVWLGQWTAIWLLVGLSALSARAAGDNVTLNGHPVHPTKILASFKTGSTVTSTATQLAPLSSRVVQSFRVLPSLVVLDDVATQPSASTADAVARLTQRIEALKNSGLFAYVEPNYLYQLHLAPTDQGFVNGGLWGLNNLGLQGGDLAADISATNAWDITTGSTNVIVAVLDTGVRYTHADLATNMWRNPGEIPGNSIDDDNNGFVDDVFGINTVVMNGNPMDDHGHGSHVAGTIGAAANNGAGAVGRAVGVCWNVKIMAMKIFAGDGGFAGTDAVITCIDYGITKGARVMNNSWGGGGYSQALYDAISRARTAGVLFVASAGNSGFDNDIFANYPSGYDLDNVVAVAATDRYDDLANFSQYGLTTVDLGAPGVEILSCWFNSDNAYNTIDGTSMAAPHVSGVAALILSKFPGADLAELRGRLLGGNDPLPSLDGLVATGGRLNAYAALTLTGSGVLQARVSPPTGSALLTSSAQPIYVEVSDPPVSVFDATVTGDVPGVGTLTFLNDGVPPDALAGDRTYSAILNVPAATNDLTLTVTATATNMVGATVVVTYLVVPPPVNDHFTNSIKTPAVGATYVSNNRFGTRETGEPVHAGVAGNAASLWWTYTATTTTNVFVDTAGSSVDTLLAVYTGNALANLSIVASNNDVGPIRQAYLSFNATVGTTYRIALGSVNSNQVGSVQLRLTPGGGPDTTLPQVFIVSPLSGTTVTTNVVTIAGTASDPLPNVSGVREVLVSVNGGFGASANGTTNWSLAVPLQPGFNIIQAQSLDAAGNLSASATIQINYLVPGPPNDFFVSALAAGSPAGAGSVDTTRATPELGEPDHAGIGGGKSVWWTFTAPDDGELFLSTLGSSFDTLLAVYTGNSVGGLAVVAANDDAFLNAPGGYSQIISGVRSNETYHIAVDGYDGVFGTAVLSNLFTPATVFRLELASTTGGSVTPGATDVPANGTITITAEPAPYYLFDLWEGSFTSLSNPLVVTVTSNMNLTARFRPAVFTDGFESGDLQAIAWASGGNLPWVVRTNTVAAGQFAARSSFISHGQSSSLIYTGDFQAGEISFAYKVSSESDFDWLKFIVDGEVRQQWSGEAGWATHTYPLAAGSHTIEWRYVKDANLSDGADAAFLDNVNLPFVVPTNDVAELTDGFESGGLLALDWVTSGALPWIVQTNTVFGGLYAARSGYISDNQSSSLILTDNFRTDNGAFYVKVSSESGYDWLRLYVDGVLREEWSGEISWVNYSFPLTAGPHTLEWRYVKDAGASSGMDAAFIDNLKLPLVVATLDPSAAHLQLGQETDGTWHVDLTGQNNQSYVFQVSNDLTSWQSFATNVTVGGTTRAVDYASPTNATRYYRAFAPIP